MLDTHRARQPGHTTGSPPAHDEYTLNQAPQDEVESNGDPDKDVSSLLGQATENDPAEESAVLGWVAYRDGRVEDHPLLPTLRAYCGRAVSSVADLLAVIHPGDRDRMRMMWQHAQATGRAFATECRLLRRDFVYRHFSLHVMALLPGAAGEVNWLHSAIDITARKRNQLQREYEHSFARASERAHESQRLRALAQVSEARFKRLLEANVIGVAVLNGQTFVEANDAFLRTLGYTREDLRAQRIQCDQITPPEFAQATVQAEHTTLAQGYCAPFEKEYIRSDGSRVFTLAGSALVEAEPPQYIIFTVDLTPQKRLEREREEERARALAAQEVSRNLDSFFATAAHDIRSPVTAAVGMVELAQIRAAQVAGALCDRHADEAGMARRVVEALDTVQVNMSRLVRMTQVLFDVARARSDMLAVRPAECDLAQLVCTEVEAQRGMAPGRTIALELPSVPAVPVVADADRISEVLANYLTNALKYSEQHQPIAVRLELAGNEARLSVADRGVGLPPDEQQRIWDPFHRAAGVEPLNGTGSLGLGLHICKRIVELHPGGRLGVQSAVGEGSTFWFSLPLAAKGNLPNSHAEIVRLP